MFNLSPDVTTCNCFLILDSFDEPVTAHVISLIFQPAAADATDRRALNDASTLERHIVGLPRNLASK